jgi:hypothetical protein
LRDENYNFSFLLTPIGNVLPISKNQNPTFHANFTKYNSEFEVNIGDSK